MTEAPTLSDATAFTLPGGVLDHSGQRHRDGWLRPLTAGDEDWLYSLAPATRVARLVTALLARCVLRIGPHAMTEALSRELGVGDRDYLLLQLCATTFGNRMARVLSCPHAGCGATLDLDLKVEDFPAIERPVKAHHAVRIADEDGAAFDVEFRTPRGLDQERIADALEMAPEALRDALVEACVDRFTAAADGAARPVTALPRAARQSLASAIEDATPRVDLDLELVCPECSAEFTIAVDPISVLLDELAAGRTALERELHVLARTYHWPLAELLALTRPRRQRFLRLIAEDAGAHRPSMT